jgi:hypothetical protein
MRVSCGLRASLFLLTALLLTGCGDWSAVRYNRSHGVFTLDRALPDASWLTDTTSNWQVAVDYSAPKLPGAAGLAGFPIGNGDVFACTGLHYPLGALDDILGPTYQKIPGSFGQIVPVVYLGSSPARWQKQEMTWLRPGGVIKTVSTASAGLTLTTYDFALPQNRALVRVMQVSNAGQGRRLGPVSLLHIFTATRVALVQGEARLTCGGAGLRCGYLASRATLVDKVGLPYDPAQADRTLALRLPDTARALRCPLGELAPGQSVVKVFYMIFTDPQDDGSHTLQALQVGPKLPAEAHQCWTAELAGSRLDCANQRLTDFLSLERYLVQVQQAAAGGFSPMDGYTKCWIRDSNGPVRYLLACGDYEAVKRYLEFQFRGYAGQGRVSNNLLLNLILPQQAQPIDWSQVRVPEAEIASFIILQRYWYWRHTADNDLIREQWPMLRRCLLGQKIDDRGTLPFFGDETYRFPGYEVFGAGQPAPDYVNMRMRSLDSAMEYVVAAQALAEMAPAVGMSGEVSQYQAAAARIRGATEQYFWQADRSFYAPALSDMTTEAQQNPFAPINLHSWWLSYAGADPRQVSNLDAVVRYLAKPSGTLLTTPEFGYYVSMIPGYLLYAMSAAGHPARDQALNGVLAAAEDSAGFAEMNTPEDRPSGAIWGEHRFRPWEGGINAEAVLYALTGLEVDAPRRRLSLSPWLPADLPEMTVPLIAGQSHFTLRCSPQRCEIQGDAGEPEPYAVTFRFLTAGPVPRVTGDWQSQGGSLAVRDGPYGQKQIILTEVRVGAGSKVTVGFDPPLQPARAEMSARQPFTWNPPHAERLKPVVLLTWDPQTLAEQRARYGSDLTVLDTKISWPTSYLRSWLFDPSGARRTRLVILDVAGWSGAFKRSDYWDAGGEAGELLKEFTQAGGQVERVETGRQFTDEVSDI